MNINHHDLVKIQTSNNIEHLNDPNIEYLNNHNIEHLNDHNNTVLFNDYEYNYLFHLFMIILSVALCFNFCKAVKTHNLYIDYQRNQLEQNNQLNNNIPNYTIIQNKIIKIKEYKLNNVSEEICSICLETYTKNDIINILKCGHKYHDKCIDGWIETNNNCPLCRLSI